jgi:hypothetical protein
MNKNYVEFLNNVVAGGTTSKFLIAMHERVQAGIGLTDNMVKALDDAMSRVSKVQAVQNPTVTMKVRKWWMNANNIDSRVITVSIERETEKAFKVVGHADISNGSWCMRCGRALTQPASFSIGFGADCASKIGIPYPSELNKMSTLEIERYRQELLGKLREQKIATWLPKSQIEDIFESA